jgi:CrcB protein
MAKRVDARDLKSLSRKGVRVRVPVLACCRTSTTAVLTKLRPRPDTASHPKSSEASVALAVALGGAMGSVARYAVGLTFPQSITETFLGRAFPLATLIINVSGSLLIGLFMIVALERPRTSVATRLFLTTGVCGGYTTMSAFAIDSVQLIRSDLSKAVVYVSATLIASLVATMLGMSLGSRITRAAHNTSVRF